MVLDIFLSSNSRAGYSQDIVDLFAKPSGAKHIFRYASKWIAGNVRDRISIDAYTKKPPAVLCYVSLATNNIQPVIMPVRHASIVEVREHGSTVSVIFHLGDFCKFDNLAALNNVLRASMKDLPRYVDGSLVGNYWLLDENDAFSKVSRSNELTAWEDLIGSYYETPNSISDMPFYRFLGLFDAATNRVINPTQKSGDLLYVLAGGKEYEARVYHFHPQNDFPEYTLKVAADDENLTPLNGDTRVLNTRYDRMDYRFATGQIVLGAGTSLAFRRQEKDTSKLISEDFVLRLRIEKSWKLVLVYIGIIAAGFAAPFVVRTFTDPNNDLPVTLAALAGGVAVGAATLLKEKIRL